MKKRKSNPAGKIIGAIGKSIKWFFIAIWKILVQIFTWIKYILICIERSAKTIALFIVSIAFLILALTTSFYLFSSAFGLKESPAFQELRDRVANIYAVSLEDDLKEIEEEASYR
jgi:magnesium-transporting ATPase (P-type)